MTTSSSTIKTKQADDKIQLIPANALNIYTDRVDFEYDDNPIGMQQKCYNDNRFYFVHKIDGKNKQEFTLPDDNDSDRYFDPGEFANVVTMPCNKKYYTWASTLMQKIYTGVMTAIIIGLIIGLIATT